MWGLVLTVVIGSLWVGGLMSVWAAKTAWQAAHPHPHR